MLFAGPNEVSGGHEASLIRTNHHTTHAWRNTQRKSPVTIGRKNEACHPDHNYPSTAFAVATPAIYTRLTTLHPGGQRESTQPANQAEIPGQARYGYTSFPKTRPAHCCMK